MTLNHSKTWPVSTLAVVQLRVDPDGRTYSTQLDSDLTDFEIPRQEAATKLQDGDAQEPEDVAAPHERVPNGTSEAAGENGRVLALPLSQRHVELFTVHEQTCKTPTSQPPPRHPYKTTVRTDTVSTILEQDQDNNDVESIASIPREDGAGKAKYEKFHVLALAKIDESGEIDRAKAPTPTVRVENWDLIYGEQNGARKLCPACTAAAAAAAAVGSPTGAYKGRNSPGDYNDRLLVDLPLDARKATTLRRHYYPEGGWGWVIITCTVLVHVLNVGLQLSCSQLAPSGAEKFKTTQVHIAEKGIAKPDRRIRITVVGDAAADTTSLLYVYKKKEYNKEYMPRLIDPFTTKLTINNENYTIILNSITGADEFRNLRSLQYRGADVFIICYAIDNKESYHSVLDKWYKEISHQQPRSKLILVGTRAETRERSESCVTFPEGLDMRERIRADDFVECSARELYNIEAVFKAGIMAEINRDGNARICTIL